MAETTTIATPSGQLSARIRGDGPPVLLVHGIPGSAAVWDNVARSLDAAGFQAVAVDLLGFGASSRPQGMERLGIEPQAAALRNVLAVLDVEPACVVGHDYGVPVAVTLAHAQPAAVSRLVLAAGNTFTDTPIPIPLNAVKLPVIGGPLGRLVMSGPSLRLMLLLGVGIPRVGLDPNVYLGDPAQRRAIATIFAASLRDLSARYASVERALPALRHPTVVLWGDRDPFFRLEQAERLAAAIPNARLHVEHGAGHFLPTERPAAFVDAVTHLTNSTKRAPT